MSVDGDPFMPVLRQGPALTSDFTTANNTNLQLITDGTHPLQFTKTAVAQSANFRCELMYSQATANVAVAFGIQAATANPTNIAASATDLHQHHGEHGGNFANACNHDRNGDRERDSQRNCDRFPRSDQRHDRRLRSRQHFQHHGLDRYRRGCRDHQARKLLCVLDLFCFLCCSRVRLSSGAREDWALPPPASLHLSL
jgi:hypothetical protein